MALFLEYDEEANIGIVSETPFFQAINKSWLKQKAALKVFCSGGKQIDFFLPPNGRLDRIMVFNGLIVQVGPALNFTNCC